MSKPDTSVTIGRIRMKNPVMVASGTFGYGPEYADLVDLDRLGAIVVKGISLEPWDGNATPRMVEVAAGLVNAIGLQNPGVDGFVRQYMPFLLIFIPLAILRLQELNFLASPRTDEPDASPRPGVGANS